MHVEDQNEGRKDNFIPADASFFSALSYFLTPPKRPAAGAAGAALSFVSTGLGGSPKSPVAGAKKKENMHKLIGRWKSD